MIDGGELAAGVVAGGAGALITQPLDCVKTRIQVGRQRLSNVVDGGRSGSGSGSGRGSLRAMDVLRDILKEEGATALFRGSAARVLWLAPGCGVTIAVFESVQRFLAR